MNGVKGPTKQKPASAESELTSGQAQAGNHEAATTSEVGIKLDPARDSVQ